MKQFDLLSTSLKLVTELKYSTIKRKCITKHLSPEFINQFRVSGLHTTVTPHTHIIDNHLREFEAFNDLGDYNMQGVEKK